MHIRRGNLLLSLFVCLSCSSSRDPAATRNENERTLLLLSEQRRDPPGPTFLRLAASSSKDTRRAVALALGRGAFASGIPLLVRLLADSAPEVRAAAAFALGCFEDRDAPRARPALVERFGQETDPAVLRSILLAVGRLGGARAAQALSRGLSHPFAELREAAALGLGKLAALPRGRSAPLPAQIAQTMEKESDPAVRQALSFALAQSGILPPETVLSDPDPMIRIFSAEAWGRGRGSTKALKRLLADADWRVREAAWAALGTLGDADFLAEALTASWRAFQEAPQRFPAGARVILAAVSSLRRRHEQGRSRVGAAERSALEEIHRAAPALAERPELQHAADSLHCAVSRALDEADGTLRRIWSCGAPRVNYSERRRIAARAIPYLSSAALQMRELTVLTGQLDPRVRAAAARTLETIWSTPGARGQILALLRTRDMEVLGAVAEVISARGNRDPQMEERLHAASMSLNASTRPEAAQAFARALGAVGTPRSAGPLQRLMASPVRAVAEEARRSYRRLFPVDEIPRIARAPLGGFPAASPVAPAQAEVVTTQGSFIIALHAENAPVAVASFASLGARGFFRSRRIAEAPLGRVLFGRREEGTPGYSLPCELTPTRFRRGSVGMETSGRDTASGRFFVTTRDAPELDGSVTHFGQVVKGMEVVDALLPGDEILEVRFDREGSR
jgi:cyclophilin family peptidyl-prolyl cis-trans isomerase